MVHVVPFSMWQFTIGDIYNEKWSIQRNLRIDTLSRGNYIVFACYPRSTYSVPPSSTKYLLVQVILLFISLLLYNHSYLYDLLLSLMPTQTFSYFLTHHRFYFFQNTTFWIPIALQLRYEHVNTTPMKTILMSLFKLEVDSNALDHK